VKKPRRARSRRKPDETPEAQDTAPQTSQDTRTESRPEPQADAKSESRPDDKSQDEGKKPSRGRSGRGKKQDDKDKSGPVGMGDHLPSFIAKSFDERMVS